MKIGAPFFRRFRRIKPSARDLDTDGLFIERPAVSTAPPPPPPPPRRSLVR